jgi:hypothetical protein
MLTRNAAIETVRNYAHEIKERGVNLRTVYFNQGDPFIEEIKKQE